MKYSFTIYYEFYQIYIFNLYSICEIWVSCGPFFPPYEIYLDDLCREVTNMEHWNTIELNRLQIKTNSIKMF